jgi:hypothetical protein
MQQILYLLLWNSESDGKWVVLIEKTHRIFVLQTLSTLLYSETESQSPSFAGTERPDSLYCREGNG